MCLYLLNSLEVFPYQNIEGILVPFLWLCFIPSHDHEDQLTWVWLCLCDRAWSSIGKGRSGRTCALGSWPQSLLPGGHTVCIHISGAFLLQVIQAC